MASLANPEQLRTVESGSAEATVREEAGEKGKGQMRDPEYATVRCMDFHPDEEELMKLQNCDLES